MPAVANRGRAKPRLKVAEPVPYSPAWVAACYGTTPDQPCPQVRLDPPVRWWPTSTERAALVALHVDPDEDWVNDHNIADPVAFFTAFAADPTIEFPARPDWPPVPA